jgi:hypothetical protein
MPTTTACRHYPYPLDPDPPNVAFDIGKLAIAIDADACTLAARLGNSESVALNAVKRAGDTMTGSLAISSPSTWQLALRRSGTSVDQPTISFQSLSGTPQFGTIMGDSGGLNFKVDSTSDSHTFLVGTIERLVLSATGAVLTGNLNTKGSIEAQNAGGNQLFLVDNNGGRNCYMSFYGDGTATTTGAQSAAIGFNNSSRLLVSNAIANGEIFINTQGNGPITLDTENAGDISFNAGTGGDINFAPNGTFNGKMVGAIFLWGKAASDVANAGIELLGSGSGGEGQIRSSTAQAGLGNLYLRHDGASNADGEPYIQFWAGGAEVARATMETSTTPDSIHFNNTTVTGPSDYRLKNDLGPITDALSRVARLRPRRITWKAQENGQEQDAFLAHEVSDVVPEAVYGSKDELTEEGEIKPQQLSLERLVPLLTAAILELLDRVEALEDERG